MRALKPRPNALGLDDRQHFIGVDRVGFEVFSIVTGGVVMNLQLDTTQDIFKQLQESPDLLKAGVTLTAITEGRNLEFKTPTVLGVRGRFRYARSQTKRLQSNYALQPF